MPYLFQYPLSALFYVAFGLLVVIASRVTDEKNSSWGAFFMVIALSLVSGLRGYSVGTDTSAYVHYYLTLQSGFFEAGYALLIRLLMLSGSVQLTLTGVSLLTYGLFVWRLWGFRKDFNFAVSMAAFMGLAFFAPWNGQRFYIAVAILFFALPYVFEGKMGRFLLLCALAFSFHRTAICGVALIPVRLLWLGDLEPSRRARLFWASAFALAVAIGAALYLNASGEFDRYFTTYESGEASSMGGSWYVFLVIVALAINYLIVARRRCEPVPRASVAVVLLTFVYLLATVLTYSIPGIGRLPQLLAPVPASQLPSSGISTLRSSYSSDSSSSSMSPTPISRS